MDTESPRAVRFRAGASMEGTGGPEGTGGMETAGTGMGALSGAEKEKLREKLALLRREYSQTVSRLRRARRAERARSHGRGGEAGGDRRQPSPAGPRGDVLLGADKPAASSQLQTEPCSDPDMEKKTSGSCKLIPEGPQEQDRQQDSPQAESSCWASIRPAPEERKSQTSRSLMKLRRRGKAVVLEDREPVCEVLPVSAGGMVKHQSVGAGQLQSPVFRRSSIPSTEGKAQRASRAVLVQREENTLTPPSAACGVVQGGLQDSALPAAPELFPCLLGQPQSPGAGATSGSCEPARLCPEDGDSAVLDTSGGGGEESSGVMEQGDGKSVSEDQEDLHRLLDFMSENEVLPADGNNTQTNTGSGGNQRDTKPFPADLAVGNAEELLENQELETLETLEKGSSPSPAGGVAAPGSSLSSCTVVEGLLFPLEYYIRTTRRMSSCQRKVDLDAVILSQLRRGKKGQRSKGRQGAAHPEQPSQEKVGNDLESGAVLLPFLGAENDPGSSGGPQTSAPASSGSSTSLGSLSQNSIPSTKPGEGRLQRKAKGRRSSCRAPAPQLLTPRDGTQLSQECQGEGRNFETHLGKPSSAKIRLSAAGEAEETCTTQLDTADPAPKGSPVLSKHGTALPEQLQNPLQSSHSLPPGNETSVGRVGDLEGNSPVCQADHHTLEHLRNQPLHGGSGAEQPPAPGVPLRRSLRFSGRQRGSPAPTGAAPTDERKGGQSQAAGGGPAPLSPPAVHPHASVSLLSFHNLQCLIPRLGIRDFHLPNEEFGPLKLEKLVFSPVNDLEVFIPSVFGGGVASEGTAGTGMNPEDKRITSSFSLPSKNGCPKLLRGESPASKREFSTHELLFTPLGTLSAGAPTQPESQISSSIFPVVGATPAGLPSGHSPGTLSVPPSQLSLGSSKEISAQAMDGGECKAPALPLPWDSCGAESARKEEEQGATFPLESERGLGNKSAEGLDLEKHQQPESTEQRPYRAAPDQKTDVAEQLTPALPDGLREESLQLVSKLKDSSGSCALDVSTMWWEAAGSRELCVVLASESSVSLWKPLESNHWEKLHTWQLGKIPVIQIIPLPDTCNLVCIALGELEIGEIRLLLYSSEGDTFRQSLVKAGNIKAVLGLQERRLVSSSRTGQEQQVEMVSLAETGRSKDGQTLMPPEETVLAFAEVEGMREALVGSTAGNSIVVWNLRTGQLLRRMQIGYSYPASICHRAYPEAGLLFVVLSHPHAKESEPSGTPAFCLVAFNPKTALSTGVIFSSLPPGQAGRYLEGDVKDTSALALLTSGHIAIWDLLGGHCTALLPPDPQSRWALARWAGTGTCLLAGQRDGTVCLYRYRYRHPEPGAA